jgi:hypothetical protein
LALGALEGKNTIVFNGDVEDIPAKELAAFPVDAQ